MSYKKQIAVLTIFITFIVYSVAESAKKNINPCLKMPMFDKVKSIILSSIKDEEKESQELGENLFKFYEKNWPAPKSESDLGVCKDYANQKSCCDINMTKLIDQAALLKVRPIQKAKNAFHKLIAVYNNLVTNKCQKNNIVTTTVEEILANTKLAEFQMLREKQKVCKINFGQALAAFNRGVMCTLCAGVDKVSDYFQGIQLKVSEDSLSAFQKATDDAITCTSQILTTENIDTILKELNSNYILNNDTCKTEIQKKIKEIFSDPKVTNKNDLGYKKCKGTHVYIGHPQCEAALQGSSDLESKGNRRFLEIDEEELNRELYVSDEALPSSTGVNIFIQSETDKSIDEHGNINGKFDGITVFSAKLTLCATIVFLSIFI